MSRTIEMTEMSGKSFSAHRQIREAANTHRQTLDRLLDARRQLSEERTRALDALEALTGGALAHNYLVLDDGFELARSINDSWEWYDPQQEALLNRELLQALSLEIGPGDHAAHIAAGAAATLRSALAAVNRADAAAAEAKAELDRAMATLAANQP